MSIAFQHYLTPSPQYEGQTESSLPQHDSPVEVRIDSLLGGSHNMASATSPYIKSEPLDFFDNNNQFSHFNNGHGTNGQHMNNVNPASLSSNNMAQSFSSSYNVGNSGITDDDILDSLNFDQGQQTNGGFQPDYNQGVQHFMNQQHSNMGMYSHTPDGQPIQSPLANADTFNYNHFRAVPAQQFGGHNLPQQAGLRPHMQHANGRSPTTPALKVSDDFSHPGMQPIAHRQQNSIGTGWDSTPNSHSFGESPSMSSPMNGPMSYHPQISEVLKHNQFGKVASSLPTKMEPGSAPSTAQEAKRRRRRESHNMVERRRRDNINERIHDLGTLVPQHRLEDEKVRKHLQTNAPLSPSITNMSSMSPPNAAASLLAGSQGRRAAGNITQGFPMDDKDKGPNKGDILNGSVAWTRDMMWYMHKKLVQEEQIKELLQSLGQEWPFPAGEDEHRMRSEICEVLSKHQDFGGFTGYSRAAGSGLRVPNFTNIAGESVHTGENPHNSIPPISPGFQPGGSGGSSGMSNNAVPHWSPENDLKEEDEYEMDM